MALVLKLSQVINAYGAQIIKIFLLGQIKKYSHLKKGFDIFYEIAARQMALEPKLSREDFPIKQQYPIFLMQCMISK